MGNIVILLWLIVLLSPVSAMAGPTYVIDDFEVAVKTGTGADAKIVGYLKSYQEVELLDEDGNWAKVKYGPREEQQGWILRKFLSPDLPKIYRYKSVKDRNTSLTNEVSTLKQQNTKLTSDISKFEKDIQDQRKELETLNQGIQKMEQVRSSYAKLSQQQKEIDTVVKRQEAELGAMQNQKEKIDLDSQLHWLVSVGGVALAGILLGLVLFRRKGQGGGLY
ncbi:MAG: TIGR04211 family SH3 domain-containing protein [Deltaproteobacteria bacterium]|nr:TIGR04211 family SH3 domain-containing protein [Deltaproteobacteria bacterium]